MPMEESYWFNLDCEPSLYFAISGPGMADSSVWPCGIMQVGEWARAPLGHRLIFSLIFWFEEKEETASQSRFNQFITRFDVLCLFIDVYIIL